MTGDAHGVHLSPLLGQVYADPHNQTSCNLCHGISPIQIRIDERTSILVARRSFRKVARSPFVFAQAERQRQAELIQMPRAQG